MKRPHEGDITCKTHISRSFPALLLLVASHSANGLHAVLGRTVSRIFPSQFFVWGSLSVTFRCLLVCLGAPCCCQVPSTSSSNRQTDAQLFAGQHGPFRWDRGGPCSTTTNLCAAQPLHRARHLPVPWSTGFDAVSRLAPFGDQSSKYFNCRLFVVHLLGLLSQQTSVFPSKPLKTRPKPLSNLFHNPSQPSQSHLQNRWEPLTKNIQQHNFKPH